MKNIVVFGTRYGYWPIVMAGYYADPQIHVFDGFANKLLDQLHLLHNKWPLNRVREMPWKRLWYQRYFDVNAIDPQNCAFVFFEVTNLAYSRRLLQYIKARFPKAKLVFLFSNPAGAYNLSKLGKVADLYDRIVTFQKEEAQKRGWLYHEYGYSYTPIQGTDLPESDLFFIGKNKGRIDTLHEIYRLMTEAGVRCDFYITETNRNERKFPSIHYNQRLTYRETLQHVVKSKCILELNARDTNYASIKTAEAAALRKRLITNNAEIAKSKYYDAENMRYFQTPEMIDAQYILQGYTQSKKLEISDFDPAKEIRMILNEQ